MAVPVSLDEYDPDARRLAAALMLRDDPISGDEAKDIVELISDLLRHSRTMARLAGVLSKSDPAAVQIAVLHGSTTRRVILSLALDRCCRGQSVDQIRLLPSGQL